MSSFCLLTKKKKIELVTYLQHYVHPSGVPARQFDLLFCRKGRLRRWEDCPKSQSGQNNRSR